MKQGRLTAIDNDNPSELMKIAEQYQPIPLRHIEKNQDQAMEIILENASIYLEHAEIVKHVNWHIKPKEQWTLIGHNGSGKSTLLNGILGFLPIAHGGTITRNWYQNIQSPPVPLTILDEIKKKIRFVSDSLQIHYTFNDTVFNIILRDLTEISAYTGKKRAKKNKNPRTDLSAQSRAFNQPPLPFPVYRTSPQSASRPRNYRRPCPFAP